ncbi:MAG: hypothetical protein JJ975_16765 [Bacteroidia bacterium]|nr:hypothetical protein [Bacteroidia bacterium]
MKKLLVTIAFVGTLHLASLGQTSDQNSTSDHKVEMNTKSAAVGTETIQKEKISTVKTDAAPTTCDKKKKTCCKRKHQAIKEE